MLTGLFGNRVRLQDGSTVLADENYVRESILQPQAKITAGFQTLMPSFQGRINEEEVMQLKVTGSEKVTVPAGSFDAFTAEITPGDGSAGKVTVWISKDSHKPVKFAAVVPQMRGATLSGELAE